jgi:hypothetical protein
MAAGAATGTTTAPYGFLIFAIMVHVFDSLVRYGTTPITIGTSPGSVWIWVLFFFLYGIVWIMANSLDAFKGLGKNKLLVVGLIAYVWGPFWTIIPAYAPGLKYIAALFMLIAPFWLLVAFYATQSFPNLSLIYSIIWFGLITFALFPNIQDYAEDQGYALPNSLNPGLVVKYGWGKLYTAGKNFYEFTFVKAPARIGEEVEQSLAAARGDYYTGNVDAAAKKRLGVYIDNFKPSEPAFYENTPVMAYATIKAETLEKELKIYVACDTDKAVSADIIRPQETFTVLTTDQFDIDCIWNKGKLAKGNHNLRMRSEFEFATRAYLKTYVMDTERLREYRRQNIDPLEKIPDKNPVTVYTSGPIRIGMGISQQPIAVGNAGDPLPSLGLTIDNGWEGKVLEIIGVFIIIPEGIMLVDIEGVEITEVKCNALPPEEQPSCDDTLVNIYAFTPQELSLPYYKNLSTKTFRIPLEVADPQKILGKAPIGVQNFKASVQYRYLIERKTSTTVKEAPQTE